MKRILIALLALMGVAVQVAPAQARVCGMEIGAVASSDGQVRVPAAQVVIGESLPQRRAIGTVSDEPVRPLRALAVFIPSVHIGPDRALE